MGLLIRVDDILPRPQCGRPRLVLRQRATVGDAGAARGTVGRQPYSRPVQPPGAQETLTWGRRPILHVPTGRQFDLAQEQPAELIEFLADLHDNLTHNQHRLRCLTAGGDKRVYVVRRSTGGYSVRHHPGSGHHGDHHVVPESDEHRRGKDYSLRALESAGVPAGIEIRSDNHTKSDVAAFGKVVVAAEIQTSYAKAPDVKRRDTRARHATAIITPAFAQPLPDGLQPIWAQLHAGKAEWLYQVPSVRATISFQVWGEHLPAPRTVGAFGVRRIEAEPCRPGSRWQVCPMTGRSWCRGWHPIASAPEDHDKRDLYTMDDVFVHAAGDLLRPLRYHTGAVYLVKPKDIVLYEELGGSGEYVPGHGGDRSSARQLGPCRYKGHTASRSMPESPPWPSPPSAQEIRVRAEGYANLLRAVRARNAPRGKASLNLAVERTPLGACSLCGQEHETCQFGYGLVCVRVNCRNPHHRSASARQA
jgi:hypothetical protein